MVNSSDFNIVKNSFGKGVGQVGYEGRADFNRDARVNSIDFNILKTNFGQAGAGALRPGPVVPAIPPVVPKSEPKAKSRSNTEPASKAVVKSEVRSTSNPNKTDKIEKTDAKIDARNETKPGLHALGLQLTGPEPQPQPKSEAKGKEDVSIPANISNEISNGSNGSGESTSPHPSRLDNSNSPNSTRSAKLPQIPTIPDTVTSRTLYIGNLYEEDITHGSTSSSPYISYYSLGGKLVGMRRANQDTGNGQYRIVGDHLGSTTLIVDVPTGSATPSVVQRQYSKPYGECSSRLAAA